MYRGITTYIILVGSKFVHACRHRLCVRGFSGPYNGIVAFFGVVFAIMISEAIVGKIYRALGDD
ncbi:hypothetical protein FCV81_00805 [Vibrio breoganii]|nr:hypothetical protein FCV81_00805 [Vibrio breoganii]